MCDGHDKDRVKGLSPSVDRETTYRPDFDLDFGTEDPFEVDLILVYPFALASDVGVHIDLQAWRKTAAVIFSTIFCRQGIDHLRSGQD